MKNLFSRLALALMLGGVGVFLFSVNKADAFLFSSGGSPDYSNQASAEFYCADLSTGPYVTQAGTSKTAPILGLTNPYGSAKNLVLLDVGLDMTSSPAAAVSYYLAYSSGAFSVQFSTNVSVIPAILPVVTNSTGTQVGLATGQCNGGLTTTLANIPVAFRYIGGSTGASPLGPVQLTDMTQGKVVIPPGVTVSIQASAASTAQAHFFWREEPR